MTQQQQDEGWTKNGQRQEPVLSRDANGVPHYAIRTVRDFLAVPEDRIGECLREFAIMLEMARAAVGLLDAVSDEMTAPGAIRWRMGEVFEWIDDDQRAVTLHVRTTDPPPLAPVPAVDPSRSTPDESSVHRRTLLGVEGQR